jgi:hypothetical protein
MRPTLIFSLMLTLTTAVMAGGSLPKQTCHTCTVRAHDCKQVRVSLSPRTQGMNWAD